MLENQRLRRPLVTSQASAQNEIENWLESHRWDSVVDGDGMMWNLDLSLHQEPHPRDPRALEWQISITLEKAATVEDLLACGVLVEASDRRLIGLVGPRAIRLRLALKQLRADSEAQVRAVLAEFLPNLLQKVRSRQLRAHKREAVCRWIDDQCRFSPHGDCADLAESVLQG